MYRYVLTTLILIVALVFSAGCASGPTEEELFVKAKKAQEARDFYAAVQSYNEVVTAYPNGDRADEAQFMIGFLYANDIRDTTKARDAYLTFLDRYTATSDSGMVLSARWELANLGKDVEDIEEVMRFAEEATDGSEISAEEH
ncbi:outer membrane protein assembly factor BamD [bacterium BMS3Bbin04]|nr:outer membrane protein assembly factor BamD [bacterium BMS3Bbin04]